MANTHVNAIVVGAGAGGGVVAKELAEHGLSVVLFERGGWPDYDAHINDELISQRTQVLGSAFGPDHRKHPRVSIQEDGSRQSGHSHYRRLWTQCCLRGFRYCILRGHGLAFYAGGLQIEIDLRYGGGLYPG